MRLRFEAENLKFITSINKLVYINEMNNYYEFFVNNTKGGEGNNTKMQF